MSALLNSAQTLCKKVFPLRKEGTLFAVNSGVFIGEFFVYMEEDGDKWVFLSLPDLFIRKVPPEEFEKGFELGILEKIETLPDNVLTLLQEQYKAIVRNKTPIDSSKDKR